MWLWAISTSAAWRTRIPTALWKTRPPAWTWLSVIVTAVAAGGGRRRPRRRSPSPRPRRDPRSRCRRRARPGSPRRSRRRIRRARRDGRPRSRRSGRPAGRAPPAWSRRPGRPARKRAGSVLEREPLETQALDEALPLRLALEPQQGRQHGDLDDGRLRSLAGARGIVEPAGGAVEVPLTGRESLDDVLDLVARIRVARLVHEGHLRLSTGASEPRGRVEARERQPLLDPEVQDTASTSVRFRHGRTVPGAATKASLPSKSVFQWSPPGIGRGPTRSASSLPSAGAAAAAARR